MIKLQKYQREAYKQFEKDGYILIDAYRRAGKTELLKYIIENNPKDSIGIFAPSFGMAREIYRDIYSLPQINVAYMNFNAHILLCDEFIMSPIEGKKIACVTTGFPKIIKWKLMDNKFIDKKEIKEIRKQMTKEAYKCLFGNYV